MDIIVVPYLIFKSFSFQSTQSIMLKVAFTNIQNEILERIHQAEDEIKVAVTWFTNHDLFGALIQKLERGIKVELIVLNDRINNKAEGLNFQNFIDKGGTFFYSNTEAMVHHKFCVIDRAFLITGSYNWTYYAENRNSENVVILESSEIIDEYLMEFKRVIDKHQIVEKIQNVANHNLNINTTDYLISDYLFQAAIEKERGNEVHVARIINESLKIDVKQPNLIIERNAILERVNPPANLQYAPFEIGVHYYSGYGIAIPALAPLPYTYTKIGKTSVANQKDIAVTIQKTVLSQTSTIIDLLVKDVALSPINTEKLKNTLTLEKSGTLTIDVKEIGGNGRTLLKKYNIRHWM
jgi:hypothetical protein